MSVMDDVAALLDEVGQQLATNLRVLHDEALVAGRLQSKFRVQVKSALENLRSTLDYLAVEITNRDGAPNRNIYYPLADTSDKFDSTMDQKMGGVRSARPDISAVIERWQPFHPGKEWIGDLNRLAREQKHNRLSLQIVRDTVRCKVTEICTGAYVEWYGLSFHQGPTPATCLIESQGGPIRICPEPGRDASAPKPFEVGVGPTGVKVFGEPLNFAEQAPAATDGLTIEKEQISRWFFVKPHVPVLDFIVECNDQLRVAITEIAEVAGLS